jgi:hypothetical protein
MVYVKSVLAGITATAVLGFGFIVYRFMNPGPNVHLTDTYMLEVPALRNLLPTRLEIDLKVPIFPDALVYLLLLVVFAAGFRWSYRRISRTTRTSIALDSGRDL